MGSKVDVEDVVTDVESVLYPLYPLFEVYSPVSGEIIEVNKNLDDEPELVGNSPENEGWLFKIEFTKSEELKKLFNNRASYEQYVENL